MCASDVPAEAVQARRRTRRTLLVRMYQRDMHRPAVPAHTAGDLLIETGYGFDVLQQEMRHLQDAGLVAHDGLRVGLTAAGAERAERIILESQEEI